MSFIEAAAELVVKLEESLGSLADLVTIDGARITPTLKTAVLVQAPDIDWRTMANEPDYEWTVIVAAGPIDRPLVAMERMGAILDALANDDWCLLSAKPMTLKLETAGLQMPCYEVKLTN